MKPCSFTFLRSFEYRGFGEFESSFSSSVFQKGGFFSWFNDIILSSFELEKFLLISFNILKGFIRDFNVYIGVNYFFI